MKIKQHPTIKCLFSDYNGTVYSSVTNNSQNAMRNATNSVKFLDKTVFPLTPQINKHGKRFILVLCDGKKIRLKAARVVYACWSKSMSMNEDAIIHRDNDYSNLTFSNLRAIREGTPEWSKHLIQIRAARKHAPVQTRK